MPGLVRRAALGFLLLAGCEKERSPGRTDQPWDRVELPGFSVEMPPGTDMSGPNAGTSYQAGTVKRARTGEPAAVSRRSSSSVNSRLASLACPYARHRL